MVAMYGRAGLSLAQSGYGGGSFKRSFYLCLMTFLSIRCRYFRFEFRFTVR